MEHGQFQIYTGNGKGKTTAAVGLIVRAAGAGLRCYLGQFIKDLVSPEVEVLRTLPGVTAELYGRGKGCLTGPIGPEDVEAAQEGLRKIQDAVQSGRYDLVVADEINVAWSLGLLTEDELTEVIRRRPDTVELVFTGRSAPQSVLKEAGLITEMREVRHYYTTKGLTARRGID